MLFEDITILDGELRVREHCYVGVTDRTIDYIGDQPPHKDFGRRYPGKNRLLMPGFFNCHAHTPMTLMRGYGENLPLDRWLHERIFPFEAKLTGDAVYWGTLLGLAESLRFGIVSTSDMYNFCEDMARAILESGAKANVGRHVVAFTDQDLGELDCFQEAKRFREQFDGAGDGRLNADLSLHAEYTSTPKVVRQLAEYAAAERARMQVHVSETREEVDACVKRHGKTPVRYLCDLGLFDVPATAAHCVWLEEEDFPILAEKGVTVASCPVSNLKLASGVCDVPRLLERGVSVAIGTDSVASNNSLDFFEEMKFFALLNKAAHCDATLVSPAETLRAATLTGALAQGRMDSGRLETGFRADLIVVDLDQPNMHPVHSLINNLVYSGCGADVLLTMVDGQILYEDGSYPTIDVEQAIYQTELAARELA